VWLCDVETASGTVRYRAKQAIKTNPALTQFAPGQILPVNGPPVEPGHKYGDEALLFFSQGRNSRLSANFILIVHHGRTGDGTPLGTIFQIIRDHESK
jgi:hypothetical protein